MHRQNRILSRVAVAVATALALTACGSDDRSDSTSTIPVGSTESTAAATSDVPATRPPATESPDTPVESTTSRPVSTDPESAATTATITHEYGTFEIPLEPLRVLALENRRDLETAVVLELPVAAIGAFGGDSDDVVAPFVPIDLDGVEIIDNAELNLEQIAALAPDLILAREIFLNDGEAEQLAQIAPILPIAGDGSWRDDLEQLAGWLQRSDLLDDALEDYESALDDVRTRHAERLATPIAIVEYYPADDTFYAGGVDDFQLQANTLGELGGVLVPFLADRSYFDEPFSIENLGEIADAGAILLVSNSQEDRDLLAANPIWQQLPAVAAGNVVVTDTRTNQGSVYAATESIRLLDQLYDTLT